MADNRKPNEFAHFTRLVGTDHGVYGNDNWDAVETDCVSRNARAEEFDVKARYEVVTS